MNDWPKCKDCGRFVNLMETHSVRMVYSGFPPEPDHEAFTCHCCMLIETPAANPLPNNQESVR